jgi:hypothetical protein
MSLAAAGDPPVPPPSGGGDLGGHRSNPGGHKRRRPELKRKTVYNRNLMDMPRTRQQNPDGTEVTPDLDPEDANRLDDEITPKDLLAPVDDLLVDRYGRPIIMPYADE